MEVHVPHAWIKPSICPSMYHDDVTKWKHFPCWLLALCEGNPPVTGGFPSQRPVTRSFDVFLDLRLNNRLSKQSRRQTILLCFICSSFAIVITTLKTKSSHNAILFPLAAPWVVITTTPVPPVATKLVLWQLSVFSVDSSNLFSHIMWGYFTGTGSIVSLSQWYHLKYRKTSNISRTLVGNKIVDNSDVVGASPVGAKFWDLMRLIL